MSFGGMLDEGDGFSVVLLASFPKSKWRTLGLGILTRDAPCRAGSPLNWSSELTLELAELTINTVGFFPVCSLWVREGRGVDLNASL